MDQKETQFAHVGKHRLAYYRKGNGEPVLFMHGITTWSFIWRAVIPHLAKQYDCIAFDHLGCGESDKPLDESYALRHHAERAAALLDTLEIPRAHIVGHDLGGGIGQIMAVRTPSRVVDLTLINTVGYDYWPVQPISALRTPVVRQMLMAALDIGAFRTIISRGLYFRNRVTPELMDYFWKPMRSVDGRKAFLHFAGCLDNHDLTSISNDIGRLAIPVLIIRGMNDLYLSKVISETLHKNIPGSRYEQVDEAGHFIMEDQPERIADSLRRFYA